MVDDRVAELALAAATRVRNRNGTVSILDHGSGDGGLSARFQELGGTRCVGIDRRPIPPSRLRVVGLFQDLPFVDDSFDLVCSLEAAYSSEASGRVVAEMGRVLRENGTLMFTCLCTSPRTWHLPSTNVDAWSDLFEIHGLETQQVLDLTDLWRQRMAHRHIDRWGELSDQVSDRTTMWTDRDSRKAAVSTLMLGLYGMEPVISRTQRHLLICRKHRSR